MNQREPSVLYHLEVIPHLGVHRLHDNVRVYTTQGVDGVLAVAYEVTNPFCDPSFMDKKIGSLRNVQFAFDQTAGVVLKGYDCGEEQPNAASVFYPVTWQLKPHGFTKPEPPEPPPPQSNDSKACQALETLFDTYLKLEGIGPVDARTWMEKHHIPWTTENVQALMKNNKHWVVKMWEAILPHKYQHLSSEMHYLLWGEAMVRNIALSENWVLTHDPTYPHDDKYPQAVS